MPRICDPKLDIKLIKTWLEACKEWHGDTCGDWTKRLFGKQAQITKFRLIDVVSQNLVILNVLPESSYTTLSYVWGSTNNFLLTTQNLHTLMQPGGLRLHMAKVPRTIVDAISLIKTLGLRYLWVDSLCIVQDEPNDKQRLLSEMHQIYMRSYVTIVAAGGDTADYGLPGIRPEARPAQDLEPIKPGMSLGILPSRADLIDESVHTTRAWTCVTSNPSRTRR